MKRLIVVAVLLIGIVGIAVFSRNRISEARERVFAYTSAILAYIEEENSPGIEKTVASLNDYWQKEQQLLILFIRHSEVDEISRTVARLKSLTDPEDHSQLGSELRAIAWQIDHIWQTDRIWPSVRAIDNTPPSMYNYN